MLLNLKKSAAAVSCSAILLAGCGGGESTSSPSGSGLFSVQSASPANGATAVAVNSKIQVTFSEPVDQTSLNAYTFQVMETEGNSLVEGRIKYNAGTRTVTFEPYTPLIYDTSLEIKVSNQVRSSAGNHLAMAYTSLLNTQARPSVSSFSPDNNATQVNPRTAIRIQLPETFNESTVAGNVSLRTSANVVVPFGLETDADALTVILKPTINLAANTEFSYTITTGVKSSSGASIYSTDQTKKFTTSAASPFPITLATSWDEYADSIKLATDGTLIVAGETWGALNSGTVEHYDGDGFIVAVHPTTGNILDTVQIGSGAPINANLKIADPIYDMVTIGNDIYVTGFTTGNLSPSDTVPGIRKMYLAKYTWTGTKLQAPGSPVMLSASNGGLEGYAISATSNGIYVIGTTTGTVPGGTNNMGADDIVVAKYTTSLAPVWVKQYGTAAKDIAKGIAVDGSSIYIAGETLGDFARPNNSHVGLNPFLLKLNDSDGSRSNDSFDTTSGTANPSNAFARVASGVAVGGGKVYLAGTQQNTNGTSTYALTFNAAGGAPTYAVDGDNTANEDEQATAIYMGPNGKLYVAITAYVETAGQLRGTTNVKALNSSNNGFTQEATVGSEMNATVRSMVMKDTRLYYTGYVHGVMGGMTPLGMGDIFIASP